MIKVTVVSGPTAAGKSTLIRNLRNGDIKLDALPGIQEASRVSAKNIKDEENLAKHINCGGNVILHYDILRLYKRTFVARARGRCEVGERACFEEVMSTPVDYQQDVALHLVRRADEACCITIVHNHETLMRRIQESEIRPNTVDGVFRGQPWHRLLADMYQNDFNSVLRIYRQWFAFVKTLGIRGWLYSSEQLVEWNEVDAAYGSR